MADDHTLFREALCRLINEWDNCKVIIQAESGKQLIKQIDTGNLPDLVLTDLRMPDMNGYQTINAIKNKYPSIKIMVISMYESKEAIMRLLQSGAQGFVNKSADHKQLKKAIYELMHTGYYFADNAIARIFRQSLNNGDRAMLNYLREEEIFFLGHICTEKTYKQIADEMDVSERHVEYLRNSLFEKLEVKSRTTLALYAVEKGLAV